MLGVKSVPGPPEKRRAGLDMRHAQGTLSSHLLEALVSMGAEDTLPSRIFRHREKECNSYPQISARTRLQKRGPVFLENSTVTRT
jgi:hypothetical protein